MYVVRKTGAENRRQKMESIFGAGLLSVCHGFKDRDSSNKDNLITYKHVLELFNEIRRILFAYSIYIF